MDRFRRNPPTVGGLFLGPTPTLSVLPVLVLFALLVGSVFLVPGMGAARSNLGASPSAPVAVHPMAPVTPSTLHGDLVVGPTNSPFLISPSTSGSGVYDQGGNISVLAGGTLILKNVTINFVQYIGSVGTISARLGHLNWFNVQGNLIAWNSTITTDARVLNAFPKLTFNVSGAGQATFIHSSLAFPGWVNVWGVGARLTLNSSNLTSNSLVAQQVQNASLLHDNAFAPSLTAGGGARVMLGNSQIIHYYKDNTTHWGMPGPNIGWTGLRNLNNAQPVLFSTWATPTDSENITRDVGYPRIAGGVISILYSTLATSTAASSTFTYGSAFGLGPVTFPAGAGLIVVNLTAAAVAQINAWGIVSFLNGSGAFGQAPNITLGLGATGSATLVNISSVQLQLVPTLQYNIVVSGAGTTFTAADSLLNVNWNLTPGSPTTGGTPLPWPWGSTKLLLIGGAQAFLANVSVTNGRAGLYWNQSAVIPDASSSAYFYRWAAVPVTGVGGSPVAGATVTAYYAYDNSQLNNQTATALNSLAVADPELSQYVNAWAKTQGLSSPTVSGSTGIANLLLVSTALTQATLPNGNFLGGYHISTQLAGGGPGTTQWITAGLTPYPLGMTPATPDQTTTVGYPNFRPDLGFGSVTFVVNGVNETNATVHIGEAIQVRAVLTNIGTGPVSGYSSNLSYRQPSPLPLLSLGPTQNFGALPAAQSRPVNFTWVVNENVTGRHGPMTATLALTVQWGAGVPPIGGTKVFWTNISILPSLIKLYFAAPGGTYVVNSEYSANGTVTFSGEGMANISVIAVGTGSATGNAYLVAATQTKSGPFATAIFPDTKMQPGTYSINVSASYNGRTVYFNLPSHFTIGGGASSATTPWWQQKFLGLELLIWIIIIAAAVAAALGALFYLRSKARGKLVECGECGQLIPEDATVCPKCGAEFEPNLVRCSRCGSTIPADSKVCPECAAQLLGEAEEATKDPERQGFADFVERFRTESKKELGDNYSEGAFWDWWKRQPTYLSFSQWRLQQGQGTRSGMSAPPGGGEPTEIHVTETGQISPPSAPAPVPPRKGGGGGAPPPAAVARPTGVPAPPPAARPPPARTAPVPAAVAPTTTTPPGGPAMKACSNCGKEIPPDYLVCPFCGAVTR